MKHLPVECQHCFFKTTLCKTLSVREFSSIFKLTKQKKYQKGDVIFKQGEKTEQLFFLTKGLTKLVYNNHGKDLIIAIEKAQTLLGLSNILNEDINLCSIVAIEDCKGCVIDINRFKAAMINNRQFMLEIMGISTRMFRRSILNFISIAHKQSNGRIADVLIFLSELIYQNLFFSLSLSRQELAEFAGCSKELIIRTLQNFCSDGIIRVSGKKVEILDMERLHHISRIG
jgi:CRP/FNR family transcriptional regulator